jgi:hypothetical protein
VYGWHKYPVKTQMAIKAIKIGKMGRVKDYFQSSILEIYNK